MRRLRKRKQGSQTKNGYPNLPKKKKVLSSVQQVGSRLCCLCLLLGTQICLNLIQICVLERKFVLYNAKLPKLMHICVLERKFVLCNANLPYSMHICVLKRKFVI